jgi:hypothetical protein
MKLNSCLLVVILFLVSLSTYAELQLEKGISVTEQNVANLASTSLPYAASFCGWNNPCPVNTSGPLAFIQVDSQGNYYALKQDSRLVFFNVNTKLFNPGWEVNLFLDNDLEIEISRVYAEYQIEPVALNTDNLPPILGCLSQNPLRYGDINQDGPAELVIYAQDEYGALNANIFSVASKKVIFSIRLATYDAVVNDRLSLSDGEEEVASDPLANKPTDGQFLSRIAEENTRMVKGIRPAAINLSKLYFDDFDNDDVVDIVSWRKLYKTRLNQDPVKGFELDRSSLIHYKLIDGEYKKQLTESSVIQGWLTAKNLTWQKGYPSKSECPGQTDQLIPEMHDPLLNDPDVLQ